MENVMQELLPYVKGFAGIYLVGNAISAIITIVVSIYIFRRIIKEKKEFDEEFKKYMK